MTSKPLIPFSGSPLSRGRPAGTDVGWYDTARADPRARFVAFHRLRVLAAYEAPVWLEAQALPATAETVFLGCRGDTPVFAVDISAMDEGEIAPPRRLADVRGSAGVFSTEDLAITGHGRALLDWHARHKFCARCATATHVIEGGVRRKCESCEAEHYPRTDPVVIMLITRGDFALLGRQRGMPPNLYTTLAGFMEPGETIEEAVARETLEEAGIEVANVTYYATQPWPFPSSLMIGCFAEAVNDTIKIDTVELEDARWFSRDEVRVMLTRPFGGPELNAPPNFAIAHYLLKAWTTAS